MLARKFAYTLPQVRGKPWTHPHYHEVCVWPWRVPGSCGGGGVMDPRHVPLSLVCLLGSNFQTSRVTGVLPQSVVSVLTPPPALCKRPVRSSVPVSILFLHLVQLEPSLPHCFFLKAPPVPPSLPALPRNHSPGPWAH